MIAHPVSLGLQGPALRVFVGACRDQGVPGIEAWHPNQTVKAVPAGSSVLRTAWAWW